MLQGQGTLNGLTICFGEAFAVPDHAAPLIHSWSMQVYRGVLDDTIAIAIKFLTASDSEGPSSLQLEQFEMEIHIMKACRFPNVVNFFGCCLEGVRIC